MVSLAHPQSDSPVNVINDIPGMGTCQAKANNAFGPEGAFLCRSGFDFTLLFEQAILSIVPLPALFAAAVCRLVYLSQQRIKAVPGSKVSWKAAKQVCIGFTFAQPLLINRTASLMSEDTTDFEMSMAFLKVTISSSVVKGSEAAD
ncbi:hypothetical protein ASPZODRAFT_17210 [Penicilliopsis zonata CBS 506.65]|uniref:Uncharacterized protein n=1 Tax=Penicilliopsis zonata CBS 506.65 TaxID=1073090 RepID=A0A1L9SF22_9EURO|nr:hypothetical protein ASPZODRAFT_17210 [Penicilliopsis zonata CBS 506.65]OJJ45769.1 hypothetical protein ASPZODRAFT_17210 [Penicilliopsis zonata CBS 506.65]